MYGVGALLALVAVLLRVRLPESPRWLIGRGRVDEAEAVVADMERAASRRGTLADPVETDDVELAAGAAQGSMPVPRPPAESDATYAACCCSCSSWLTGYVTVYGFSAGFTSVLTAQGYEPPEAGVIVAVGAFGFLLARLPRCCGPSACTRKVWLPISAVITVVGSVIVAAAGDTLAVAFIGSAVIFFGSTCGCR